MNKIWLNKQGNKSCILYFNGWAEDENAVNHLDADDFDICMFNDYNPISPIDEKLNDIQYDLSGSMVTGCVGCSKVIVLVSN